jgi:hypothetical protein
MTRAMPLWLLVGLQGVVSAASLVVEIVAGRMLAPHVGMSLYTWTAVIAVVLAGFSVGHWWGGRLAGKPAASALAWTGGALLAAAVTTSGAVFVLPVVAGPVLASIADPVWAITALTALAFFLPSFFAGVPAPVLAQIAVTTQEDSGPALGAMFASGAVGAIAGTLLAGFVFIAWLGSTLTLVVVTLVYVASGLLCFWLGRSRGMLLAVATGVAATGLARLRRKARGTAAAHRPARRPRPRCCTSRSSRQVADAHMLHQRLGAVMARAHRDALLVEHGRDVVGMARAVDREGEDRALVEAPIAPARSAS